MRRRFRKIRLVKRDDGGLAVEGIDPRDLDEEWGTLIDLIAALLKLALRILGKRSSLAVRQKLAAELLLSANQEA